MRTPLCHYHACGKQGLFQVSGGLKSDEHIGGWLGVYCMRHALGCVQSQIFQVPQGMPIAIALARPVRGRAREVNQPRTTD